MDLPGDVADVGILARRRDFLSYLTAEPAEKPAMVENLDHSRSTVDRAIGTLEDAGFVERTTDGYVTTLTGQLALERYDAFLEESQAILSAQSVLNALPSSFDLPQSVLTTAEIDAIDTQYQYFEQVAAILSDAEEYRVALPTIGDTRHIRMLHARVTESDLDAIVLTPEAVYRQLAREFPSIALDLDEAESLDARETSAADVAVLLATSGDVSTVVVLVYENQDVVGLIRSTDEDAVSWARQHVRALAETATETTLLGDVSAQTSATSGGQRRIPARLREQGFARIDEQYFDNRSAVDPVTAWQAGIELQDVAAGYAFDRSLDDEQSMTGAVTDRLVAGENVALLGPPGSGKSTTAKQVAYAWFDGQRGPVFYREGGQGQMFDAVDLLEQTLEAGEGRTLVVVEDAVRADANAVFQVMQQFADREDIVFLLDARQSEWRDPDELPIDTHLETFRKEDIETVLMPSLDEHERDAILDRFETLLSADFDGVRGQLLEETDGQETTAGDVFLFFHRLTRNADPLRYEESPAVTSLDEHVDSIRATLAEAGDDVFDIGVLAIVLNAAGIAIHPEYLHALGVGEDRTPDAVRTAIDILDGEVLFRDDGTYQTVHDVWSVRFLQRLLEAGDEQRVTQRFGDGISALLALADEPGCREAVAAATEGDVERLPDIAAEPTKWADGTARQLFDLGYPKLVSLFGSVADPSFDLPAVCSTETYFYGCLKRGEMYFDAGRPDRARAEFETVIDGLADPVSESDVSETEGRLYAKALHGLGGIAEVTGGDVIERYDAALEAFETVGDERGIVLSHLSLASQLVNTGQLETGRGHVEQALDSAEQIDDVELESLCHNSLGEMLIVFEDEQALEEPERALELAREAGSRQAESAALRGAAIANRRMGSLSKSVEFGRQWLDVAKTAGDAHSQLLAHTMLSTTEVDRGHLDAAADHLDRASDLISGTRIQQQIHLRMNQGRLAWIRGDNELACERFETALELSHEQELWSLYSTASVYMALAQLARGERPAAREYADQGLEIAEEHGLRTNLGRAHEVLGRLALEQGELDRARETFETAFEIGQEVSVVNAALARCGLGDVAHERGDDGDAREYYEHALETLRENERARLALDVVEDLAEIDDPAEWYDVGAEVAAHADLDDRATEYRDRAQAAADQRPTTD